MTIAYFLSLLSNDYLLMLVAVVFYIKSKKPEYGHLIILLLFAMIYKSFLKELLQIPAPAASPTKYGFPSGHINFATMFYGWFMINYRTKLMYGIGILALTLASISTVYLGYHDKLDVIVTPIIPIFILYLYQKYLKDINYNKFTYIFVASASVFHILSYFILNQTPIDVFIGSYGILGFGILQFLHTRTSALWMILIIILYYAMSDGYFYRNCIWFVVFATLAIARHFIQKRIG